MIVTAIVVAAVASAAVGIAIVASTSVTIVGWWIACVDSVGGLLLLLHNHAVLLHCAELALEKRDGHPLRSNALLSGGVRHTKVRDGFAERVDGGIIFVDSGHPISV